MNNLTTAVNLEENFGTPNPSAQGRDIKTLNLPSDTVEDQVVRYMRECGYIPPVEIVFDGQIHRFSTNGKPSDKAGWYIFFNSPIPAGAFGDWRRAEKYIWSADIGRSLTKEENVQIRNDQKKAKRIQEKLRAEQYKLAADKALDIWTNAKPATADHQYLQKKLIQPHIARVNSNNELIIPVYNEDNKIMSLQRIDPSGTKRFLYGGQTGGGFCILGEVNGAETVYLVEGFATGASVYENLNAPVIVCFSANNLKNVATIWKNSCPKVNLVIIADNDESGTGERAANEAAEASGAFVIVPPELGDANDYVNSGGSLRALLSDNEDDQYQQILKDLNVVFGDELSKNFNPPDELVENLICLDSIAMVYGSSNSGKTFFALEMAHAVSSGIPFLGRKTESGFVVYIACESPGSVESRLQVIRDHYSVDLANLAIVRAPVNFHTNPKEVERVTRAIKLMEQQKKERCKLLIIDTLARISAGANENSGDEMGPIFEMFDRLRHSTHAAITIIHHSGKDEARGSRGWSGMRAHIDTEIEIKKGKSLGKESLHSAEVTKQRDLGSNGDKLFFKLKVVEIGITKFGRPATSCIVIPTEGVPESLYPKKVEKDVRCLVKAYQFAGESLTYEGEETSYISKNAWVQYIQDHEMNSKTGEKLSEEAAVQRLKTSVGNQGKSNMATRLVDAGIIAEFKDGFSILKKELVYHE